jgi:hypothetical protein
VKAGLERRLLGVLMAVAALALDRRLRKLQR